MTQKWQPIAPSQSDRHRVGVPRDSAVRTAIRALWTGLTSQTLDIRYSLLWVALEALFGANESGEITYKVSQRIAFFLANTPEEGRRLFRTAKKCYGILETMDDRKKIALLKLLAEFSVETGCSRSSALFRQRCRKTLMETALNSPKARSSRSLTISVSTVACSGWRRSRFTLRVTRRNGRIENRHRPPVLITVWSAPSST